MKKQDKILTIILIVGLFAFIMTADFFLIHT
jgi:hypothetical protein